VLSAAEQATADLAIAPRGRLEQHLLDLGVRDAGLLRQGAGLDKMAQQVLVQAHRSGQVRSQPDAEVAPQLEAAGSPAEVAPSAEAAAAEPEMDGGPEISPG
jgi:hypothetical protein